MVKKSVGTVVEFGTGTGNLTAKLIEAGHSVIGIEPNDAMRTVTAKRFPDSVVIDGDLLDFEKPQKVETFVSTYVFHHLKDNEKEKALFTYANILPIGGKIVFADTVFISEEAKQTQIAKERARGFNNVADDLEREYYTTIPVLTHAFEKAGFDVQFEQMNDFVWLMDAIKK